jgi:phenylpropionate dioxygenase-like ring-hydroxylating dioxygenase large terminal subunit
LEILGIMSDLSITRDALVRGCSQLPVTSYFDATLFERERETLFRNGPRYVGHALSVPDVGNYHVLTQEGDGRALVRTAQGVELVSNVCRHRQAVMLRGRGTTNGNIVCPLHRWTYDLQGQLIGAPHFQHDPCLNLRNYALQQWNGLLFEAGGRDVSTDLAALGARADLDFSGYVYDRTYLHECDYNWKSFIEVYLEDYHVGPFHPGLGNFVSCDDLRWEMGPHYSVQTVGVARSGGEALGKAGSPVYRQWQDAVLRYQRGTLPQHGAVWLTYYPGVMVEWYPNVLVVSTLIPKGPRKTLNVVEFFYPEEIAAFERDYVDAQQAAYLETCVEDDEIALRMDAGRQALMERGDDDAGPYQSPMEDGMQHFHEWYRRQMQLPA